MEAPTRYPAIPSLIERCPTPNDLFADQSGWPQLNASKERELESALKKLAKQAAHEARKRIRELDQEHGERRSWVWAQLERSPLALAIGELAEVARICEHTLAVSTIDDMVAIYKTSGWQILSASETGDPSGMGWTEIGVIDSEGHADIGKFAKNLDDLLQGVEDRIMELLEAGWKQVEVVTDHGFITLPGGLPTTKLANNLSENTWGRCASLKAGAHSDEAHYSWFWNTAHTFALASGVNCFGRSREYTHGGLSLQECLTERFSIRASDTIGNSVKITDTTWRGMRLTVAIEGASDGLRLDVRQHAGDSSSSLAMNSKAFKDGKASVVIEDDSLMESKAYAVILGEGEELLAQFETRIGGM